MYRPKNRRRAVWPWVLGVVAVLAILATIGVGTSATLFLRWGQVESATPDEATVLFDGEFAVMEDDRAYLTISESGTVDVQRELEKEIPNKLVALNVLAYEPAESNFWRVRVPFWFVKLKSTEYSNLGTLVALLLKDWEHLALDVTQDDLLHRGPGLVLDHTNSNGERIVVWSE